MKIIYAIIYIAVSLSPYHTFRSIPSILTLAPSECTTTPECTFCIIPEKSVCQLKNIKFRGDQFHVRIALLVGISLEKLGEGVSIRK